LLAVVLAMPKVLPDPERWVEIGLRLALDLILAVAAQRILFVLVGRTERLIQRTGNGARSAGQRARTLGQILRSAINLVVFLAMSIHVLAVLGWDVRPLLAGAGIVGVALGFGAQTLVRDVIAGLFILAENQYGVGDLIEVNGRPATVEVITVRSTTLRDFNGYVHFVPNGEMKTVVNRSRDWNRAHVDIGLPPGQDVDHALAIVRSVTAEMNEDPVWRERMLDPIQVWGLDSMGTIDSQIRLVVRARPGADLPEISRELRLRIVRALSLAGIRTGPLPAPSLPEPTRV
jgi:small conductance mechanosensitive channel